jgi:cytochrome b pre-mRNA-processing protein 3
MILRAFRRNPHGGNIHALYGAIVAQARCRLFYSHFGVPDTVEGRFELIVMHLVLILGRLARQDKVMADAVSGRAVGQQLFDIFCRDLDDNLREMGVGDLAVPKKMRGFAEAFYGRQAAYGAALAAADQRELEKALARNIFAGATTGEKALRLARYARAAANTLDAAEEHTIAAGQPVFPSPEAFIHA